MNPRPILIATCIAIALVAFVYFFGKQHFSPLVDGTVDRATRKPTSKPVTVNKSPTPNESLEPEASAICDINIPTERKDAPLQRDTESTTYTSGPYKGLTYEQAMAVYEWHTRDRELCKKWLEKADQKIALSDALVASVDEELSLILSAFKLLPPDTLQLVRNEAEKRLPAADVKMFFDDLANHSISMTPDQIAESETEMRSARKLIWIANDQLTQESRQAQKAVFEHIKNYPQF